MRAEVTYNPDNQSDFGAIQVWDTDKFEWRDPTEAELIPALTCLVLKLHKKLRGLGE